MVFSFCKTAFKPYDVTVCAALIAFKHRLGPDATVSSDGNDPDWEDGRMLATVACGKWANEYHLRTSKDEDGDVGEHLERVK